MRKLVIRLPLLAVSVWMGWSPSVGATDLRYGETVYLAPTILSVPTVYVPTSSVVSSSYLVPSALYVPSYYATAYVADEVVFAPRTTTYVETQYRPGLLGRLFGRDRVVERSFISSYPTAYVPTIFSAPAYYSTSYSVVRDYTPTVFEYRVPYETAYVTSPASACDEVVSSWRVVDKVAPSVPAPGAAANSRAKQVESRVTDEGTIPSNVDAAPGAYTTLAPPAPIDDAAKAKSTTGSEADSPPAPPVLEKEKNAAPTGSGAAKTATNKAATTSSPPAAKPPAPKVPAGEKNDLPIESAPNGETRRDSQKPAVYPLSALRPERRNILFGKVESSAGGQPEEEVRIIVASRSNRAIRHEGMTDAYGRFAIKLTDGDWTVNVTMPKGSVYPVSQITVASGRIFDATDGREVPSLIITR
jgi:hypothetical protein